MRTALRRTIRSVALLLLLAIPLLLAACGKDKVTKPNAYTLTGRVRLTGTLKNAAGDSIDVQYVDDADSVPVYLYQGSTRKDSTRTTSGQYRFADLRGGPYSVATILWGDIGDTVSILSVTSNTAADTLLLESSPTMIGFPNPFQDSTAVRFALASPSAVEVIVRKPSGLTVSSLANVNMPAGYHQVMWHGKDDSQNTVPAGPYWILFRTGTDYRCRLAVKL